jgi:glycosyltransferase involved in cell wall biosynthesis
METSKTLISIIVPVFNQEKYIGRCIRSLLNQSFQKFNYEIIIVNDGSSDKTAYALEIFYDSIIVINNKKNLGLPASINKGIKKAKGKYIVRVDSDDYVNHDFLNFLFCYLEANTEIHAVACDYWIVNDEERHIKKLSSETYPIACGILFYKKHLVDIGLYDEAFYWHEERDLRFRFEKKYRIGYLKLPLYRYRKHANNHSNNKDAMDLYYKNLIKKHGEK